MKLGVLAAAAALLGLASGCPSEEYFVCTQDSQCSVQAGGRCEPSGSCSFPDADCPTGRRYGGDGNPTTANQCVPPDDLGTSGGSSGASGDGSGGPGGSVSSGDAATGSGSSDGSTGPQATSTSSSTGVGDASSSTGGEAPPDLWSACETSMQCSEVCAVVVDEISLDPIAGWCTTSTCEDPLLDCTDPGTGATPACLPLQIDGQLGDRCMLDCTETGDAGCPDGMQCFETLISTPRCAHPIPG